MYCKKCGAKNEKSAKFCTSCGEELTQETKAKEEKNIKTETPVTSSSPSDAGGIRKAMKKDAKKRVNGHLIGATAIYLVVCIILSNLFKTTTTISNGVSISTTSALPSLLTAIVGVIFTYGLLIVSFKALKDEKFEFSEVFLKPFENMKFLGYALLLSVIITAASFVLVIIPILGWIAFPILLIYYTPAITTFWTILADPKTDKDITFTEVAKQALELVKGNRVEYYGVTFSFIGWMLVAFVTCGILFIWLAPYMELTYVNLYKKWTKEKGFDAEETGLSNGAIIGITGGAGCGCLIIISIICVVAASIAVTAVGNNINNPNVKDFINDIFGSINKDNTTNNNNLEDQINDIFGNIESQYNS